MAGANVTIDNGGLLRALGHLAKLGEDMTPAMRDAGDYFLRRTEARFDAEQGPGGVRWAELKPSTRKRKRHSKILTESEQLRNNFSYRAEPDGLLFGTSVLYAAIHQFGGSIERGAYSSTVRLRTDAGGNLLRQGGEGKGKNLAVFAKDSHKRARSARYTTEGFTVGIPARPFLGVDEADGAELEAILFRHLDRLGGENSR